MVAALAESTVLPPVARERGDPTGLVLMERVLHQRPRAQVAQVMRVLVAPAGRSAAVLVETVLSSKPRQPLAAAAVEARALLALTAEQAAITAAVAAALAMAVAQADPVSASSPTRRLVADGGRLKKLSAGNQ